ncbi:MAG: bacillithiol biosynthesis cysteine-adding enzyme BshC [Acidobacteria bacterium]|nr:bacillithiol biosynthesis cysteine-adding enzyme BshC [Acidobacteriota bacterium]
MTQTIACPGPKGNVVLRVESLPFAEIPNQSRLFIQYQNDPLSLRKYYPSSVQSHTQISDRIPEVLKNHTTDRGSLCDALEEMNQKYGASARTLENISLLREPDSVAVVTGQQAGLFSGPLYTIYKALSAVRAAECLRGRGFKAVPVFWAATEDHDFEEVSKAFVIDTAGNLAELTAAADVAYQDLPVGEVKIGASMAAVVDKLFDSLAPTEFSPGLRGMIESSWREGEFFGDAFAKLLSKLMGDYGLVILCPLDPRLKKLASPIYETAIKNSGAIVAALRARSAELVDAGFSAQVLIGEDYFPLFWHDEDNRRIALKKTVDGKVRAKDGSREFTLEELARIAVSEPRRLSPSVVLRSVVQDFILPTVWYFGGAAEVSYFAQSEEVYRILERPTTPILHRQSFTFVEPKHAKTLSRFELEVCDLFQPVGKLLPEIVEEHLNSDTAKTFAGVEEGINTELNRLDQALLGVDKTLAENLARRRRKILYHIAALRNNFHKVQMQKDEVVRRRIESMFTALVPARHLQERTLNISYFLNRYGVGFVDWIYRSIDLDDKSHRILYI